MANIESIVSDGGVWSLKIVQTRNDAEKKRTTNALPYMNYKRLKNAQTVLVNNRYRYIIVYDYTNRIIVI